MHKVSVREKAITLRESGYSYSYISSALGISKSTLSGWLTDIPYTPNDKTILSLGKARAAATKRKSELRQAEMQEIREKARSDLGVISERDLLLFGLGLYMGEGAKTHGVVRVVNSDPNIMKAIIPWFLSLGVTRDQFYARVFIYPDSDEKASIAYWSKIIKLPVSHFQKTYVDRRSDKKAKKNGKLPYGTLHLGVRSGGRKDYGVRFSRRIQALNEVVLDSKKTAGLV